MRDIIATLCVDVGLEGAHKAAATIITEGDIKLTGRDDDVVGGIGLLLSSDLHSHDNTGMNRLPLRPWGAYPSRLLFRPRQSLSRRPYTSPPPKPDGTSPSRLQRIESRLPTFLRRYLTPLRSAPLSHITAFLILHELTAIVPLFGLAAVFHYTNWLPPLVSEGKWVSEGTERFGKWLRKRGWIGERDENRRGRYFGWGETGTRVVVELATAYAITKAMLPVRLVGSVWATPWFARWTVLPLTRWVGRRFGRNRGKGRIDGGGGGGIGTNAVGGGAVPKKGE